MSRLAVAWIDDGEPLSAPAISAVESPDPMRSDSTENAQPDMAAFSRTKSRGGRRSLHWSRPPAVSIETRYVRAEASQAAEPWAEGSWMDTPFGSSSTVTSALVMATAGPPGCGHPFE